MVIKNFAEYVSFSSALSYGQYAPGSECCLGYDRAIHYEDPECRVLERRFSARTRKRQAVLPTLSRNHSRGSRQQSELAGLLAAGGFRPDKIPTKQEAPPDGVQHGAFLCFDHVG